MKSKKVYSILRDKIKDSSCLKLLDQVENCKDLNESK